MTMDQPTTLELTVTAADPERRGEPITCGTPWPRGALHDLARLRLHDGHGKSAPIQTRALDRWPDGSVRWTLLDWQAAVRGAALYRLSVAAEGADGAAASGGRQPPD